jgi:hypothetical protein
MGTWPPVSFHSEVPNIVLDICCCFQAFGRISFQPRAASRSNEKAGDTVRLRKGLEITYT